MSKVKYQAVLVPLFFWELEERIAVTRSHFNLKIKLLEVAFKERFLNELTVWFPLFSVLSFTIFICNDFFYPPIPAEELIGMMRVMMIELICEFWFNMPVGSRHFCFV